MLFAACGDTSSPDAAKLACDPSARAQTASVERGASPSGPADATTNPESVPVNTTVSSEERRFKGWPANGGMWSWGNELVVMYTDATFGIDAEAAGANDGRGHAVDKDQPFFIDQSRSTDGGQTWSTEKKVITKPGPPGYPWFGLNGPPVTDLRLPVNFNHPDFAMHVRAADAAFGESYWYYSYDRARTWRGPYRLPRFGLATVNGRTDYIVNSCQDAMVFLSGSPIEHKSEPGSRNFMARTRDGGMTWDFVANTSLVPTDVPEDYASEGADTEGAVRDNPLIRANMPSSVRLSDTELISISRVTQNPPSGAQLGWMEAYRSTDNGATWAFLSRPGPTFRHASTPPALTRLASGDLVLTYGYRIDRTGGRTLTGPGSGFGFRAVMSRDGGKTWSDEVVLRDDGGTWDLGYTRSQVLPDGNMVTAYYFNTGVVAERTIEATVWSPAKAFAAVGNLSDNA